MLLLTTARAQPRMLGEYIMEYSNASVVPLTSAVKWTVTDPIDVIGQLTVQSSSGSGGALPRLECATSCFVLRSGATLTLTGLDVVFGTTNANNSALVVVSAPMPVDLKSNLTLIGSKIAAMSTVDGNSTPLSMALIKYAAGAAMALIRINTTSVFVDALASFDDGGIQGATEALPLVTFEMMQSTFVCYARDLDCLTFHGNGQLRTITVAKSHVRFSTPPQDGFAATTVIRILGVSTSRPDVSIQSYSLPPGERLAVSQSDQVVFNNVTIGAECVVTVSQVDRFIGTNVTQLASILQSDRVTFVDVRSFSAADWTVIGAVRDSTLCVFLPAVQLGVFAFPMVPTVANFTRLKVNGTFCTSSNADDSVAVVRVKDTESVKFDGCQFVGVAATRAVSVTNASVVNVLGSRFADSKADSISDASGFVRVFGGNEVRTQLTVENSVFETLGVGAGSALTATGVVATLRNVNFTGCYDGPVYLTKSVALLIDNGDWAFASDTLLDEVTFTRNRGIGVVRIESGSLTANRNVQFRRVRIDSNTATDTMCALAGATNYTLDTVSMYNNSAKVVLNFPDNIPIDGTAKSVCLCSNTADHDSFCMVMSMLTTQAVPVLADNDSGCFSNKVTCGATTCSFPSSTTTTWDWGAMTARTTVKSNTGSGTRLGGTVSIGTSGAMTTTTSTTSSATSATGTPATLTTSTTEMAGTELSTTTENNATSAGGDESSSSSASSDVSVGSVDSVGTPADAEAGSVFADPAVLGGVIGGIVGFVVLVAIAVAVGVTLVKRRRAGGDGGETDVPMTTPPTGNYGSVQSVLPAHYGESKFADLE